MPTVLLFSKKTGCGVFRIETDQSTFDIKYDMPGRVYALRNDRHESFCRMSDEPYDPIRAVAEHRTGIPEWDASREKVSDYAPDWERHPDKLFQMRLLDAYLTKRPDDSLRSIVDYFKSRHSYVLERMAIDELLTELITTGQLDKLPSMHMAPAEMTELARIAAHWLRTTDTTE
ncbi:MAG: hypothetical protein JWO38_3010 [Gemmataceae bacterium]|nr:hypothetical protein [Gemmataceae bacterium]